jgi:hypothetical protein
MLMMNQTDFIRSNEILDRERKGEEGYMGYVVYRRKERKREREKERKREREKERKREREKERKREREKHSASPMLFKKIKTKQVF